MRETSPSLYDLRRSYGRNPSSQDLKFIYAWVPTTHNFTEDFGFGEENLVREALPSPQDLWLSEAQFPSGQDLKSEYSSKAMRGHRNPEFSLKIRAEVREGRGSRGLQDSKKFYLSFKR